MQMLLATVDVLLMHAVLLLLLLQSWHKLEGMRHCRVTLRALHHVQCNVFPLGFAGISSLPGNPSVCSQK
jgi:hypothetical protein